MSLLKIHKAKRICGKMLTFRNVTISDAAFILSLRTNEQKSKYISKVKNELNAQVEWLKNYEYNNDEAYFIIENNTGVPLGTVRIYDARGESFCWGSWILVDSSPSYAAIESALIVYTYALESLNFVCAHFQVNKYNKRVWMFHERFGAERVLEDDVQYEYVLSNAAIQSSMNRYRRYLPDGIAVENIF